MNKPIPDIYHSLQEIAWHFGSHGMNGECCGDLSFVEFMGLKKIFENADLSIQEIGNALNFTKSGATRIINRLENKGYVSRVNSASDGRICCVVITGKGVEVISKIMENYTVYLEEVLHELEPPEVDQMKNALELLLNAVRKHKPFDSKTNQHRGGECC